MIEKKESIVNWQGNKDKDSIKIERQCQWEKQFFRAENMEGEQIRKK